MVPKTTMSWFLRFLLVRVSYLICHSFGLYLWKTSFLYPFRERHISVTKAAIINIFMCHLNLQTTISWSCRSPWHFCSSLVHSHCFQLIIIIIENSDTPYAHYLNIGLNSHQVAGKITLNECWCCSIFWLYKCVTVCNLFASRFSNFVELPEQRLLDRHQAFSMSKWMKQVGVTLALGPIASVCLLLPPVDLWAAPHLTKRGRCYHIKHIKPDAEQRRIRHRAG